MENHLILAVTTIGDLLINNKITSTGNDSIDNITIKIPEYQRPYKWTAKNATQLLDDIIQAMYDKKETYRVGTLILHQDKKAGQYDIVDGQQRTITFSLLLKALGEDKLKFLNEKLSGNQYNYHNVKNNYRAFVRRLENAEETPNLKEYIKNHCELIVVITNDLSEAFQFFDSQNARGKALYPHDLLKAYHLREMRGESEADTEKTIRIWEDTDQKKLSALFQEHLYRLKEWLKGKQATQLTEQNIELFKGVTGKDNFPYAQFYKGAFAYAEHLNQSSTPFVTGSKLLKPFQINAPIVAGKPFFEYTQYYFDLLTDIQDNDKYRGYFINGNEIVKTLDKYYKNGVGNRITRLMFDTSVLLYVDRFCPFVPSRTDMDFFEKFVKFTFVWAYSMRAQYYNVGWIVAQNFITEMSKKEIKNSLNIYKIIVDADSPNMLISNLSDMLLPLTITKVKANKDKMDEKDEEGIYTNYLHYFNVFKFLEGAQ